MQETLLTTQADANDESVEDFTVDQEAMLKRLREIWDRLPAEQKSVSTGV